MRIQRKEVKVAVIMPQRGQKPDFFAKDCDEWEGELEIWRQCAY